MLVRAAHPRSRGENVTLFQCIVPSLGSSPLTRGKPALPHSVPQRPRLIPAHAGKTLRSCHRARRWPAHPRSRGENKRPASDSSSRVGSSPLTRGKLPFGCRREPFSRLIPAHAGKTVPTAWKALPRPAHPRSRGENPGPVELSTKKTRLIPAHAGKTCSRHVVQ